MNENFAASIKNSEAQEKGRQVCRYAHSWGILINCDVVGRKDDEFSDCLTRAERKAHSQVCLFHTASVNR